METRNILYLHETSILGGAERSLLNLVDKLDKTKFNLFFICPPEGIFVDELRKRNIECDFLDFPRIKSMLSFKGWNTVKKIIEISKKKDINLIHSSGTGTNLLGAISAKITGIPIVWHARNVLAEGMFDTERKELKWR